MIRRTVLEWQRITYGEGEREIPEWAAERLGISLKTLYNRLEAYRAQAREANILRNAEPELSREQAAN